MKKYFSILLLLLALSSTKAPAQEVNNVVYSDANARITLVTDGIARLEYAPDGKFVNNHSFIAINRTYPQVKCSVKNSGKWIVITTESMTINYLKGSGKFNDNNLKITSGKNLLPFSWKPSMKQKHNLLGTTRTLDGCEGWFSHNINDSLRLEQGLLATDGWTLLDDSKGFVYDNSEWPWVEKRVSTDNAQDWYFLAYGHNYKKALKDFTVLSGKIPLPPRFAFGFWWSRYWCYSDNELRSFVKGIKQYNLPIDVLVIDMDWHYTQPGRGGWTGYTWNRSLFPSPEKFLHFLKDENIKVTMNIHPADGVASFEDNYKEMAEYMHHTPSKYAIDTIPYEGSNKNFMTGWLKYMLEPREKQGINFWWLDWQQALNDGNLKGLSTTYWINYVVFSNMERKGQDRPMLYHRWGGLGNHRYQIGFSGDVVISWESLKLQPYFTATASNVLYGFWSHDLGGHYNFNLSSYDHEIYLRWLQCGVYNPIFRIHSTKQAILNKEPWMLNDKEQPIMFDLIHKRYALDPYIYTSARESHNTGVSMCRPMYYDYPEDKQSYEYRSTEYMFGDQILVKPITDPLNGAKYSKINIWLPEGNDWYELSSGTMLKGGQTVERQFSLSEFPDYVKAGAIIPMYDNDIKNLQDVKNNEITVNVYPGGKGNHFDLYEDNGNDVKYESNYATTPISTKIDGNTTTVTIGARTGSYTDMPSNRQYKVKFNCVAPPTEVTVNGAKVDYEYVGNDLAAVITVPETSCAAEKVIKVTFPSNAPNLTCGYISRFHRIIPAIVAFKHINSGVVVKDDFGLLESAGRRVSYFPEQFNDVINKFKSDYNNMKAVMTDNGGIDNEQILWFQREINWETIK